MEKEKRQMALLLDSPAVVAWQKMCVCFWRQTSTVLSSQAPVAQLRTARTAITRVDAPDGRWGIVLYESSSEGRSFSEWSTVEHALKAFDYVCSCSTMERMSNLAKHPGFKRRVTCGALTPWFYAIGGQQLIGDYAFPEGVQDDPVYRFGIPCVVFDHDGIPTMKVCMGTQFVTRRSETYPYDEERFRVIHWSDGTVWDERSALGGPAPRPAEEGEMWIVEALQQFSALLAGQQTRFTINFTNGEQFVGKLVQPRPGRRTSVAGNYHLVVKLQDEKKTREGWIEFNPTEDAPDVVQFVTNHFETKGHVVEYVKIKGRKTNGKSKKWEGAFFPPPR